jgi:hypothetical protein
LLELRARKTLPLLDSTGAARDGDLEHVLGQIHGNGSSIHLGLLLSD